MTAAAALVDAFVEAISIETFHQVAGAPSGRASEASHSRPLATHVYAADAMAPLTSRCTSLVDMISSCVRGPAWRISVKRGIL